MASRTHICIIWFLFNYTPVYTFSLVCIREFLSFLFFFICFYFYNTSWDFFYMSRLLYWGLWNCFAMLYTLFFFFFLCRYIFFMKFLFFRELKGWHDFFFFFNWEKFIWVGLYYVSTNGNYLMCKSWHIYLCGNKKEGRWKLINQCRMGCTGVVK